MMMMMTMMIIMMILVVSKVPRPDLQSELLGLDVLDEPVAGQADPSVLDLQLRAVTKEKNKVISLSFNK